MLLLLPALALAADLPTIAKTQGLAAAKAELDAIVAKTPAKKLAKALDAAHLDEVKIPAKAFRGAELAIDVSSPASGCQWDGELRCALPLASRGPLGDQTFDVVCHNKLGVNLSVSAELLAVQGGFMLNLKDLGKCWELGDELLVVPHASDALQGVGQGDDFHAPELTGLTRKEVDDLISGRLPAFKGCLTKGAGGHSGQVVLAYEISESGKTTAKIASSTIGDAAVEGCLVERLQSVPFPPPMGGWSQGTYPFTFQ
jgi:hypothetical protein